MSLLAELTRIGHSCNVPIETGVFSESPPDAYLVLTPLNDHFALSADNSPGIDVQEVRISLFSKGNYLKTKNILIRQILDEGIFITDRRYLGHEDDTDYHHYAIDVANYYELEG